MKSEYLKIILMMLLLSGCAPNMVRIGEFYNTVEMILPSGYTHAGRVTFDSSKKDGVIEFKDTPYGSLKGYFTTVGNGYTSQSSGAAFGMDNQGNTIVAPVISNQSLESNSNYGQAFLKSGNKVVLRCTLNLNFPKDNVKGGIYAIGQGSCYDDKKDTIILQFIHTL